MKFLFGLLAPIILILSRVNGKEIPDDEFLASMFGNESRNPMEFFFKNALKIKLGQVDDVKDSILSFKSDSENKIITTDGKDHLKNYHSESGMQNNGLVSAAVKAPDKGGYDVSVSINESIDEDDEGSGFFDNGDDNQKFYEDEDGKDNDDNDGITVNSTGNENGNAPNIGGSNRTAESDIEILPMGCDFRGSKNPPEAAADYSLILTLLLQCLKREADDSMSRVPPPSSETKMGQRGDFPNDAINGGDHMRIKRSAFRRISRYEYFWAWLEPYINHSPYRKTFDSIASGIIGKRSQFD